MFCRNCGRELSEGDKFCSECGTPVKVIKAPIKEEIAQNHNTSDIASDYKANNIASDRSEDKADFVMPNVWADEEKFEPEIKNKPLTLDWSSVVDEPRKKKTPELRSPWEEPFADDYAPPAAPEIPELNVDFGGEPDNRGRTLTFIDILKQEKEERERSNMSKDFADLIAEEINESEAATEQNVIEEILPANELEKTQGYTDLKQDIIAELVKTEAQEAAASAPTSDFDSRMDFIKAQSEVPDLEEVNLFDDVEIDKVAGDEVKPEGNTEYSDYTDSIGRSRRHYVDVIEGVEYEEKLDEAEELELSAITDAADDTDVVDSSSNLTSEHKAGNVSAASEFELVEPEISEPVIKEPEADNHAAAASAAKVIETEEGSIDDEIAELQRKLAELMGMKDAKQEPSVIIPVPTDEPAPDSLASLSKDFDIENIDELAVIDDIVQDDYDIEEVLKELEVLEKTGDINDKAAESEETAPESAEDSTPEKLESYGEALFGPEEPSEEDKEEALGQEFDEFDSSLAAAYPINPSEVADMSDPEAGESYDQIPVDEMSEEESAEELVDSINRELKELGIEDGLETKETESDKTDVLDAIEEIKSVDAGQAEDFIFADEPLTTEEEKSLEEDLFADGLFEDDEEAEATKKIEKFYTLYRKNEEFQKLLDEEYKKLQGGGELSDLDGITANDDRFDVYADASSVASVAATPASDIPTVESLLGGKPVKTAEVHEEVKASAPDAVKKETGKELSKKEQKALAKAKKKEAKAADKDDEESGGGVLTVIAIVIAVLLVILLAMILLINFAPNSGIAKSLSSIIGNFTTLFGDAGSDIGTLL